MIRIYEIDGDYVDCIYLGKGENHPLVACERTRASVPYAYENRYRAIFSGSSCLYHGGLFPIDMVRRVSEDIETNLADIASSKKYGF